MMLSQMIRYLHVVVLISAILVPNRVESAAVPDKEDQVQRCHCVPDQWEGLLSSSEREFDLREAQTEETETKIRVHYDYTNKKFAMVDAENGKRAIADYNQGYKYIVGSEGCYQVKTEEDTMKRMCLPDEAELLGEHVLATSIPIGLWEFSSPHNLTTRTTVMLSNCLPISEDIFMLKGAYCSSTHSLYVDMSVGIRDVSVFAVPDNCESVSDVTDDDFNDVIQIKKKRGGSPSSFSESIMKELYN